MHDLYILFLGVMAGLLLAMLILLVLHTIDSA